MKKRWQHSKSGIVRGALMIVCAAVLFISQKSVCFAEVTGKVKAPTANIRKTADKSSEPVGSTSSGKTITLLSQTTDSDGYVWYEVYVDTNTTGYIRSDLVDVDTSSGTLPTSSAAAPAQSSEQPAAASTASGAEILPETGMDAQYATITGSSVNVRSAASKSKAVVGKVKENAQVVVTGQTEGTDKTWYYVTFTDQDGTEKTGYVRSDMLTLGDMVLVEEPVEEPQPETQPEESEPETQPVRQDYEVKYELDEKTGEYVWRIYDYTASTEYAEVQNLKDVLAAAHAQSLNNAIDAKTVSKQRIVIIVLIAVIIILAVAMTIMIFKLRDAYYEAYEDDEDDEEDEAERRRRERKEKREREAGNGSRSERGDRSDRGESRRSDGRRTEERGERRRERGDGEEPVRRKSAAREERQTTAKKRPAESERDRRMPDREVSYEEEAAPVKTAPKKKAKNFMIDDDDFEFEFLNMKNKDNDI